MKKDIVAKLTLEDFSNNIVLNPSDGQSFGRIYYNLFQNNFYYVDCQKIYFRVPGEHSFPTNNGTNIKYDMEVQTRCHVSFY